MEVISLRASDTHSLRARLLYAHWADADVHYPEDELAGAFHLGVTEDRRARHTGLVAVASWYPQPCAAVRGRPAYRLRGMAVDSAVRARGVGRLLFEAGVVEVVRRGGDVVWANARDSAIGFYTSLGMRIVGERFTAAAGLPHHVVVRDLRPRPGGLRYGPG